MKSNLSDKISGGFRTGVAFRAQDLEVGLKSFIIVGQSNAHICRIFKRLGFKEEIILGGKHTGKVIVCRDTKKTREFLSKPQNKNK